MTIRATSVAQVAQSDHIIGAIISDTTSTQSTPITPNQILTVHVYLHHFERVLIEVVLVQTFAAPGSNNDFYFEDVASDKGNK